MTTKSLFETELVYLTEEGSSVTHTRRPVGVAALPTLPLMSNPLRACALVGNFDGKTLKILTT
jgi:hypothetical protein